MVNFKNLFRRQSTEVVPASTKSNGQADSPETQHDSTPPSDLNTSIPSSRSVEPSSVPAAQVYIPPPPNSHNSQHTAQNIGMAAGAVIGENNGSGMGMGMVEGMVGAGMINQVCYHHRNRFDLSWISTDPCLCSKFNNINRMLTGESNRQIIKLAYQQQVLETQELQRSPQNILKGKRGGERDGNEEQRGEVSGLNDPGSLETSLLAIVRS